jgi:hypothetical protein
MSKPNEQVITGTSNQGSFQEALDAAVSQVGHGQAWRLASIDGQVGGTAGNDVHVRIFAVTQAAGATDGGTGDQEQVFEVPTSRTGRVVDISGQISICQDGARYELVERGEQRLRLKATNPDAEGVLAAAAGTTQEVTVSGYIRQVECERMDVYDAARPVGPVSFRRHRALPPGGGARFSSTETRCGSATATTPTALPRDAGSFWAA